MTHEERLKGLSVVDLKWENKKGGSDSLQTEEMLLHKGQHSVVFCPLEA